MQLQWHARHPEHPMPAIDRKQVQSRLDAPARIPAHRYLLAERFEERMRSRHHCIHLPFSECIDRPH